MKNILAYILLLLCNAEMGYVVQIIMFLTIYLPKNVVAEDTFFEEDVMQGLNENDYFLENTRVLLVVPPKLSYINSYTTMG